MRRKLWAAVAALWALTGAGARASEEQSLGTVVITGTRTEAPIESVTTSVTVVGEDDIRNRQSQTVADTLRDVPGVDVAQSGSLGHTASVFIRGAESNQSLILFDGVEVNSPMVGGVNFGNLTTDDVGRIEVLRGAGGTLYGSQAIGGVVNVLTKKGSGAPHLSLSSGGGNTGTTSQLATLSGESGPVAYSAALGYLTTAGFRQVNDDFSNLTSALRVDVTPIEHGTLRGVWRSATSSLGLADNNIGLGLGRLLDPDARQRDEFYVTKMEWEHQPLEALTYRVSGAYSRTVNDVTDRATPSERAAPNFFGDAFFTARSLVPSDIWTGEGQVNYSEGSIGVSTLGVEFKERSGDLKSETLDGTRTHFFRSRSNLAGYAQQQVFLLDNAVALVGGLRVDDNEDFGREVSSSWSVGYLQDWNSAGRWATHIKGSYAEGFRAPTFDELFFPGFGNPNLNPEISSEYDGSVEQQLGVRWVALEGTYFSRRTRDLIQFSSPQQCPGPGVDPNGFGTLCNVGLADTRGVETVLRVGPVHHFSASGAYTYLDFDLSRRTKLLRRPHNRMAASVAYDRDGVLQAADAVHAHVNVVFVGERTDIDPLTFADTANPTYTRVDLALRYTMPLSRQTEYRLGWFARVQNLLDRRYDEVRGFRAPPVNVLAGATVTF